MSRSRRKKPVAGITSAETEKQAKRKANRRVRRWNKALLDKFEDDTLLKQVKEITDVWDFPKDGKRRFYDYDEIYRK